MLQFQVSIYGAPGDNACRPLPVTFDQATAALQLLERLFIEADGSFVWTGSAADGESWQVDGNLIDRGDALACVELKGRCREKQLEQLLAVLGWPRATLSFHLPQRGAMLDETTFRQLAAGEGGAI